MSIEPKLMDPEDFAAIEGYLCGDQSAPEPFWDGRDGFESAVHGVLAHAKHWEVEARRYRDRCPVEASDVKAAGVTWAQCYAVFMREIPDHRAFLAGLLGVMFTASMDFEPPEDPHEAIAGCVSYIEMFTDRDRWAILAEMAAMDPS